jgi:4-amino-4-deoxy-L-arabinose transferase-like glycosyltransferase
VTAWLITRGTIVFACLQWPLVGDEDYLHRFVGSLVTEGFTAENLAKLSTWYDYPVWVSRAFPIYLPLRILFGDKDIIAVRIANVLMGAATLLFLYLLAKHLVGARYARCAAFLYLLFPYHFFDAVSFTPQIPGTLLVTVINWLILRNIGRDLRPRRVFLIGGAIGALLFAVRIQRGGFDLLILAGYPILLVLYAIGRKRTLKSLLPSVGTLGVAFLVWAPSAYRFDSWVAAHDVYHLRSHALGFMVRGSNPVSLGEYLPRYERLDAVSTPEEKSRVLWSVLATESAREPGMTLGVLPLIKAVKLFMVGHASAAVSTSNQLGYSRLSNILRSCADIYAPFLLILCLCGLTVALVHPFLAGRVILVCWFTLSAALAIIFFGESDLIYSHGFQPELVIIAALGAGLFRKRRLHTILTNARKVLPQLAIVVTGVGIVWICGAAGIYWVAVHAEAHLFRDTRGLEASINGVPVPVRPLNRWTQSWEQSISVPAGTTLPANIRLQWSGPPSTSPVRMSIWTDGGAVDSTWGLVVPDRGRVSTYSDAELVNMKRGEWAVIDSTPGMAIEILLVARSTPILSQSLAVNVGYAQQ